MPSSGHQTSFKRLQRFEVDFSPHVITQYESERTGMRVVVADQEGPKVNGFFTLATEIHDDSGAPHTLEHLCFMGSKSYKYKGFLDKLATRAYSNTNAWTATDHTAYTLDTAGWEGFAQILPVYLEHVLLPTLTDSGCYTEVHHVDGAGQDAGVVYSEMQGVQNNQGSLMDLKARRLLYPENVGFRYETGGMMEQLRVLSADRIRAFHKEMYQPKNLCVVIIGEVDHENLLNILDNFEEGILGDIPSPNAPFKRPWIESPQPQPLKESIVESVEFPEEDESSGEILIGFLGPDANDPLLSTALQVLLVYLAGSSVSILENILVEKEQVASAVYTFTEPRPDTVIWFDMSSVATEKLATVEKRLFEVLKETAGNPLDMSYMIDCVKRQKRQLIFTVEESEMFFSEPIISDFLFGRKDGSTLRDLETLQEYDELERWTDEQWRAFLRKWISDAAHVSILGIPSAKLAKKIKSDEETRVEEQKKKLGEEGLKRLENQLEDAKAQNDKEIPSSLLENFKVPGVDSIHFIETTTAKSGLARKMGEPSNSIQKIIDQDQPESPLFIHFEHVPTNFLHFTLVISTESIPVKLRPLLSVYFENFFNTPVTRNGETIGFEQVVTELEKDTLGYGIEGGGAIDNPEVLRITFQVEREKYETAIRWMRTMLWDPVFDETRIKAAVTKLLADIPDEKRSGGSMLYSVRSMVHLAPESLGRARDTLVKALYLKRLKHLLKSDAQAVISQMEEIKESLCRFDNFRILVIADLTKLQKPVTSWSPFLEGLDTTTPLKPLDRRRNRLSEAGKNLGGVGYIVPMSTIDTSYSLHTARGPTSFDDPQLPALMVAIAYLTSVEGPLWVAVRGTGLAYGTSFSRSLDSGHLSYRVSRSPDAYKAFMASKAIVEGFASGATDFEAPALEGAISSIVVGFANEQPRMGSAAQISFVNQVIRNVPRDYNTNMLKLVREVSVTELRAVLNEIVLPIFTPAKSDLFVTCAPIMEQNLKQKFEEAGFKPEVQPLSYFQDDYGLKAGEGEEENEADDDEELEEASDEDGEEGDDDDDE